MVGEEREEWICVVCAPLFSSSCNVSPLVPLLCLGPFLVWYKRKAWVVGGLIGAMEGATVPRDGGHRGKASRIGAHSSMMALAPRGGRDEGGCCPR